MKTKNYTLWTVCVLLLGVVACTTDPEEKPDGDLQISAQKLVNTSQDAAAGSLLISFDDTAVAQIENHATRAAADAVVTRSGITDVDDILARIGVTSFHRLFPLDARHEAAARAAGLHKWYVLNFPAEVDLDNAATELAARPEVARVEFNTRLPMNIGDDKVIPYTGQNVAAAARAAASDYTFNDPYFSLQWDLLNTGDPSISQPVVAGADIDAIEAWKLCAGDPSIVVAVVDMGVEYSHPDLQANMWVNKAELLGTSGADDDGNGYVDDIYGYNFVTDSGNITWDLNGDSGHGTHVAGSIAAVNNNGLGISSIAGGTGNNDGVKIMGCQVGSGGNSLNGDIASAIYYAANNGACIIQCSWGVPSGYYTSDDEYKYYDGAEKAAIDYFVANASNPAIAGGKGGLAIFAAGNDEGARAGYPGAYRDYISVTSFGPDGLPAYYTNYGPGSNIAAPGGDYYISTDPYNGGAQVLSTVPSRLYGSDYGYMQGTSQACPHVSGVAALGLSYALKEGKTFTLDEFKAMLLTSVNDLDSRLTSGTKYNYETGRNVPLTQYYNKMGTGAVDAYQLLMQIDGTPLLRVGVGEVQMLPLDGYFGAEASNLTYTGVEISDADMAKLGISAAPAITNGELALVCTKPGVATITVHAIAGGNKLGTGSTMGGMEITKNLAIIARQLNATNGGWL